VKIGTGKDDFKSLFVTYLLILKKNYNFSKLKAYVFVFQRKVGEMGLRFFEIFSIEKQ
jgi:hypothetical protein